MKKVRKAIIPAAGLGTRFLPATKAMPKEMLPIVDKPTIQYIIEEAVASGIEDIIIVTGKGKRAIEDHFDNAFEFGSDSGFLGHIQAPMGFGSLMQLSSVPELCGGGGGGGGFTPLESEGFGSLASGGFVGSRAKVLKPLEVLASSGAQPTLFQKRAAMRQSSGSKMGNSESSGMRRLSDDGDMDETGVEVSGLNYESDELNESGKASESVQNGGGKGKKKGMPAKNLMAERRRRKKLNDRLYMLRSVVPKISKVNY